MFKKKLLVRMISDLMLIVRNFFIIFLAMTLFVVVIYFILHYFNLWSLAEGTNDYSIGELYSVTIVLLTIGLISVGWIQLNGLRSSSRGDFLLRIDNRFGSEDVMQAKAVIHEIACRVGGQGFVANDEHIAAIANEVDQLRNRVEEAQKFLQLQSFLDFLETIAYFASEKLISIDDIQELLGIETLVYYYKIFKRSLIPSQRKYLGVSNHIDYSHLDGLAQEIIKNRCVGGNF